MTALDEAITVMNAETATFQAGTKDQPKPGTPEFFIMRAKFVGLSMLKQMRQLGLENDPKRVENFYRTVSKSAKIYDESAAFRFDAESV